MIIGKPTVTILHEPQRPCRIYRPDRPWHIWTFAFTHPGLFVRCTRCGARGRLAR